MDNQRLKLWEDRYYNKKIVDFSKYLNKNDIEILKKIGIELKEELYTEYEFDLVDEIVFLYYRDDSEVCLDLEEYDLKTKGVSRKEYNKLLSKFIKISKDYNF